MTIKQIADEAGVSTMTVSNVINNRTNHVSQKTIDRVNEIIRKHNYVPNLTARSLVAKSSQIIGIIVTHEGEDDVNVLENPYVSTLLGVLERELRRRGYYSMIRSVNMIDDIISLLGNWNCDGAIFLEPSFDNIVDKLASVSRSPLVFFDSSSDSDKIINVAVNDYRGGYLAAKYLIAHGHRRIAFMGNYDTSSVVKGRYDGYTAALRDAGIEPDPAIIYNYLPSYELGVRAGREVVLSGQGVTAMVTTADFSAIGVMEGARMAGARIPYDLSVIGFDNLNICNYTTPKLTSVSQDLTQKGKAAVDLLMRRINGETLETSRIDLDVEIVERQSVAMLV